MKNVAGTRRKGFNKDPTSEGHSKNLLPFHLFMKPIATFHEAKTATALEKQTYRFSFRKGSRSIPYGWFQVIANHCEIVSTPTATKYTARSVLGDNPTLLPQEYKCKRKSTPALFEVVYQVVWHPFLIGVIGWWVINTYTKRLSRSE